MKKFILVLLCITLICTLFTGCGRDSQGVQSASDEQSFSAEQSAPSKNNNAGKLRICMDMGTGWDQLLGTSQQEGAAKSFLSWLDDLSNYLDYPISSEDVEVELIPGDQSQTTERKAALQRIRTEIMAGKGPDVFICASTGSSVFMDATLPEGGRLFPYMEKSIEDGLFLPLDDYMDRAVMTHWDDMHQKVLDGGKNSQGQQVVIPLTFSLPMNLYAKGSVSPEDYAQTTWDDVLTTDDPFLAEQTNWPFPHWVTDINKADVIHSSGLSYILPDLIDFQTGEITWSEEEMTTLISSAVKAYQRLETSDERPGRACGFMNASSATFRDINSRIGGGKGGDLLPLRNVKGGTTALIVSWCAVNANTKDPEGAFEVVDALLGENYQGGKVYSLSDGMPISKVAGSPGNQLGDMSTSYLFEFEPHAYEQWLSACDQITDVHYMTEVDAILDTMMKAVQQIMFSSKERGEDEFYLDYFADGEITDEQIATIVHNHYQMIQRLLDES